MTEAEWLACEELELMLAFLRGKVSDRKLRLFATACCRNIWTLLDDERSRLAVQTSERYVEGLVSQAELLRVRSLAEAAVEEEFQFWLWYQENKQKVPNSPAREAAAAVSAEPLQAFRVASEASTARVWAGNYVLEEMRAAKAKENRFQCHLLRDLIGNPFRPAAIDLGGRGPEAAALAETIYDHGSFDRLPELAEALQEAGCQDPDILAHCRSGGEHVRGCWLIDLLLGKS